MAEPREAPNETPKSRVSGYFSARMQGLMNVGAGNVFASTVIAGLLLGYLVDRWLGWAPVGMMVGGLLGFVGGMRNAHRLMLSKHHGDNV